MHIIIINKFKVKKYSRLGQQHGSFEKILYPRKLLALAYNTSSTKTTNKTSLLSLLRSFIAVYLHNLCVFPLHPHPLFKIKIDHLTFTHFVKKFLARVCVLMFNGLYKLADQDKLANSRKKYDYLNNTLLANSLW